MKRIYLFIKLSLPFFFKRLINNKKNRKRDEKKTERF
jgi:hypothetical protein